MNNISVRVGTIIKCSSLLAVIIAVAGNTAQANAEEAAASRQVKPFVVIDSIHYRDKGDMAAYGMKDYTIFYGAHLWPKNLRGREEKEKIQALTPPDERISDLVKNITITKSPVIYDIEHWPLDIRLSASTAADDDISAATRQVVAASMDKMIHIITTSRKVNPSVKYGYYSCVPLRDYWSPVKNNPEMLKNWRAANDYLKPLADSLDVICPSLYAFYPDRDAWVKYAKANIEEAKRMANGKPVYVFLWPKYHNSNKAEGKKFIEGGFWKLQLETVHDSGVDGIIIWDSPLVVNNPEDKAWNPEREWWKETVNFLEHIKR